MRQIFCIMVGVLILAYAGVESNTLLFLSGSLWIVGGIIVDSIASVNRRIRDIADKMRDDDDDDESP